MKKFILLTILGAVVAGSARAAGETGFAPLFTSDGVPQGWKVGTWNDVSKAAPTGVAWRVTNGVLHGSEPRGTWLVSEREYGDFILEYEWKLGERGNSGCGLRFPGRGRSFNGGASLPSCFFVGVVCSSRFTSRMVWPFSITFTSGPLHVIWYLFQSVGLNTCARGVTAR